MYGISHPRKASKDIEYSNATSCFSNRDIAAGEKRRRKKKEVIGHIRASRARRPPEN
jgi:hypothetical protein